MSAEPESRITLAMYPTSPKAEIPAARGDPITGDNIPLVPAGNEAQLGITMNGG